MNHKKQKCDSEQVHHGIRYSNKNKMCKTVKNILIFQNVYNFIVIFYFDYEISKHKYILTVYTSRFYLNMEYQDALARDHIFVIYVEVIRSPRFL